MPFRKIRRQDAVLQPIRPLSRTIDVSGLFPRKSLDHLQPILAASTFRTTYSSAFLILSLFFQHLFCNVSFPPSLQLRWRTLPLCPQRRPLSLLQPLRSPAPQALQGLRHQRMRLLKRPRMIPRSCGHSWEFSEGKFLCYPECSSAASFRHSSFRVDIAH